MSWVQDLTKRRAPQLADAKAAGLKKPKLPEKTAASLGAIGLSDKLINQYGSSLRPALTDLRAVFANAAALRPHKAGQFQRALERYYGDLGKSLAKLPEQSREPAAKLAIKALRVLVERVGASDTVVGGIAALQAMLFVGAPTRLNEIEARTRAASETLDHMLDVLDGRTGATTVLFGMRNIIELAEKSLANPRLPERQRLWRELAALHIETSPPSGADQADVGRLASRFIEQLKLGLDPFAAIAATKAEAVAVFADSARAIEQQLAAVPNIAKDTPRRRAYDGIATALLKLLDQHRAGPASMLQAIEHMATTASRSAKRITDENEKVATGVSKVIELIAGSPAAESVLRHLSASFVELLGDPAAAAPFVELKKASDVPKALVQSKVMLFDQEQRNQYNDLLKAVQRLPEPSAQRVALAVLPHLQDDDTARPLLQALPDFARTADTMDAVQQFTNSFVFCWGELYMGGKEEAKQQTASALAAELNGNEDNDRVSAVQEGVSTVLNRLPKVSVAHLLRPGSKEEASLLDLRGENAQGRDPGNILGELLPGVVALKVSDEQAASYVRRMLTIANQLARLDREPDDAITQIVADWKRAAYHPEKLSFATRAGGVLDVRAKGQRSIMGFLEAHPELPPELAVSAGVHLSKVQLTWLTEQIKASGSHAKVRDLRDLVFALIKKNKLELLELLRKLPDPKIAAGLAHYVAQEFRQGRIDQLKFASLIKALERGEDPLAAIHAAAHGQAAKALGVDGKAQVDQEGVAQLAAAQEHITGLVSVLGKDVKVFGDPSTVYRQVFETSLQETAAGTWPHFKYESPVGVEQLAGLTADQRAMWMQDDRTAKGGGGTGRQVIQGKVSTPVRPLLAGLVRVLPKVDLSHPNVEGLGWNQASQKKLIALQEQMIEELRAADKGSKKHQQLSRKIGPISDRLALLDLYYAAKTAVDSNKAANAMVAAVKGTLPGALAAARQMGATGIIEVLDDLSAEAGKVKSTTKVMGNFAADESHVTAFVTSFDSGCIGAIDGFNKPSMIELIASAQYKMGRVYDGDVAVGRTILRLVQIKVGKYKGYALRADPTNDTGHGNLTDELSKLLFIHVIQKAQAMGIPALFDDDHGAAKALGLKTVQAEGSYTFHRGHTGVHHTQGGGWGPYFTAWEGVKLDNGLVGHRVDKKAKTVTLEGNMQAVLPKGVVF